MTTPNLRPLVLITGAVGRLHRAGAAILIGEADAIDKDDFRAWCNPSKRIRLADAAATT